MSECERGRQRSWCVAFWALLLVACSGQGSGGTDGESSFVGKKSSDDSAPVGADAATTRTGAPSSDSKQDDEPVDSTSDAAPLLPGVRDPAYECPNICGVIVSACGASLTDCVRECEQDEANSADCGQEEQWLEMMRCCTEAEWDGCDEESFDACQKDVCGHLRPTGAAEGCSG